jgi:hypothetical protein
MVSGTRTVMLVASLNLAGFYLNAATAEASEVQAAEILGSASGEPGQVLHLTCLDAD